VDHYKVHDNVAQKQFCYIPLLPDQHHISDVAKWKFVVTELTTHCEVLAVCHMPYNTGSAVMVTTVIENNSVRNNNYNDCNKNIATAIKSWCDCSTFASHHRR